MSGASSQQEVQSDMKGKRTGKDSGNLQTDWKRLRTQSDEDIRRGIEADPDAAPTDAEFWKGAKIVMPRTKQTVTIRLDSDLLEWLCKEKGYQTRINAILRTYMDANRG
jgi:uncharacterized protein (DUF4415 family)